MKRCMVCGMAFLAALVLLSGGAGKEAGSLAYALPVTLGFDNITTNNPDDAASGEEQLFVEMTEFGSGQVLFTFGNLGPAAASITDIYFDEEIFPGLAWIDNSDPGVSFTRDASPPDLPGGNLLDPPFVTSLGFSADTDEPTQAHGVYPGESLGIAFDVQPGGTFTDVLGDVQSGALRIGLHVQGFDGGGSESFVNTLSPPLSLSSALALDPQPIPEPRPLLLLGTGLLGLIGYSWWRKARAQ